MTYRYLIGAMCKLLQLKGKAVPFWKPAALKTRGFGQLSNGNCFSMIIGVSAVVGFAVPLPAVAARKGLAALLVQILYSEYED